MKKKILIWIKRYLPAEVIGSTCLFLAGLGANALFHNPFITAVSATWAEFLGYYGTIVVIDLRKHTTRDGAISFHKVIKTIKHLLFEFGFSEILDTFVVRPFSLYLFPLLLGNIAIGLFVGKIAADIIFYVPTIIAYELRVKFGRD